MKDMAIDRMNELKAPEMMSDYELGILHGGLIQCTDGARARDLNELMEEHVELREYARRVSQTGTNQDV